MNSDLFWRNLRYVLVAVGVWIIAKAGAGAYISNEMVDTVVGLIISAGAALWGNGVLWGTKPVPEATANRADVPTVSSATGAVEPTPTGRTV